MAAASSGNRRRVLARPHGGPLPRGHRRGRTGGNSDRTGNRPRARRPAWPQEVHPIRVMPEGAPATTIPSMAGPMVTEQRAPADMDWWVMLVAGLVAAGIGILVLTKPGESLKTLAVIAGIYFLFDSVVAFVVALARTSEHRELPCCTRSSAWSSASSS